MSNLKRLCIHIQRFELRLVFWVRTHLFNNRRDLWLVGVAEVCGLLQHYQVTIPKSKSFCFWHDPFEYDLVKYDFSAPKSKGKFLSTLYRIFWPPILLGWHLPQSKGVVYNGMMGFLLSDDEREFEFQFIKKHSRRVICCFLGSDIRSVRLSIFRDEAQGSRSMGSYVPYLNANWESNEVILKRRASIADAHADVIFNFDEDQISYQRSKTIPPVFVYPNEWFNRNLTKFDDMDVIKIVHAPSSPLLKGTQVVHIALQQLLREGFKFEYIEIRRKSNSEIRQALSEAHIVLGQFYAYVPGITGIEALANACVLLTSADERTEKLPKGSNSAWVVTSPERIYDNLKHLLLNVDKLKLQASVGFDFAVSNFSRESNKERLLELINGTHSETPTQISH